MQNCKQLKQKDADLIKANARLGDASQAFEGVEAALKSKIDTLQKEKSNLERELVTVRKERDDRIAAVQEACKREAERRNAKIQKAAAFLQTKAEALHDTVEEIMKEEKT